MGMPIGCSSDTDVAFAAKHNITVIANAVAKTVNLCFPVGSVLLSYMQGDCTAATLCTSGTVSLDNFDKQIPIIQEYLSINARINCFGTRMCKTRDAAHALIKVLTKHKVKNISVNIGNRDKNPNYILVSFNIKVPAPLVREYRSVFPNDILDQHDHMNFDAYNALQKEFGLYINSGKVK